MSSSKHPVAQALEEALQNQSFDTLEELQAFAQAFMNQQNHQAPEEFHGLSPEQMHKVLHMPFDCPELVEFQDRVPLADCQDTPFFWLFAQLIEAIGEKGLKPTATGNLPRNLCRSLVPLYREKFSHMKHGWIGPINTEADFQELNTVRVVAELAGLIRKYRGKFILSQKCRNLLTKHEGSELYPFILKTSLRKYNWGYQDGHAELAFIQHSALFSIYLLHKYGDTPRPIEFYSDAFLNAFPMILHEVPPSDYHFNEPAEVISRAYQLRVLDRFASFMGLAQLHYAPNPDSTSYMDKELVTVTKTPLLDQCWKF